MTAARSLALVPTRADAVWLSAEQVMQRAGWSERTFFRRKHELISRESGETGSNGRPVLVYLEASIPQNTEAAPLAKVTAMAPLGPLFANLPASSAYPIVLKDPEAQAQAAERNAILQPLIDFIADPRPFARLVVDGKAVDSQERMVQWLVEQHDGKFSARTLKRWLARYREGGFTALADSTRSDKGQSRWFATHPKAAMLAAYLHLGDVDERGKPIGNGSKSIAFVHEQVRLQADVLGLAPGDLPSYETVRLFLPKEIPPAISVLAREGKRAYGPRMSPYLKRGYDDIFANQVWVGDMMKHDREKGNDVFLDQPYGAPVRVVQSAMIDYRSRKVVGASWTWFGGSSAINATILRAVLDYGPPELFYVDNGKDYKKVAKGAHKGFAVESIGPEEFAPIEKTGFMARIGAGVTHCIPRHPQSKHIERFFRTQHMGYDSLGATYTSGSPATRPEYTEEAMMRHRRLLKRGRAAESQHPLVSTFILGCLQWIEEYNNRPHSGEGMDGMTPNEAFEAFRNPNQKPVPDYSTLAMLMSDFKHCKVDSCGIRLNRHRYTPRTGDRDAWAVMHHYNEREILVAYDQHDPEFAAACDTEGRPIAWLVPQNYTRFAPNDPEVQQQIGEHMKLVRGLEKATRETIGTIAAEARGFGARNGEEMLFSRLQLPANTAPVITQRKPRLRPSKSAVAPATATEIAANFWED